MALVLELSPGRSDVRMPDLGELAARELDVALADRRLDLKQQDRLLDVQHLWHDVLTVARRAEARRRVHTRRAAHCDSVVSRRVLCGGGYVSVGALSSASP